MSLSPNQTKWFKLILRFSVTVCALIWVFYLVDLSQVKVAMKEADWRFLVLAWFFNAALFWTRSYRFQLILKKLGCFASVNTLFSASAMMALYGLVMPGMLSLAAKWYVIKKATGKGGHVVTAMVYNQVTIMVVMVAFGLLALSITNPLAQLNLTESQITWLSCLTVCLFLMILGAFAFLLSHRAGAKMDRALSWGIRWVPDMIRKKAEPILEHFQIFRTLEPGFHLMILILGLLTGALGGGVFYMLAAKATHIQVPFVAYIWMYVIIFILGRIPVTLSNCGLREFVLMGLLGVYGVDKPLALLMSMIIFSAHIFMAFIGALYQISWSLAKRKAS